MLSGRTAMYSNCNMNRKAHNQHSCVHVTSASSYFGDQCERHALAPALQRSGDSRPVASHRHQRGERPLIFFIDTVAGLVREKPPLHSHAIAFFPIRKRGSSLEGQLTGRMLDGETPPPRTLRHAGGGTGPSRAVLQACSGRGYLPWGPP